MMKRAAICVAVVSLIYGAAGVGAQERPPETSGTEVAIPATGLTPGNATESAALADRYRALDRQHEALARDAEREAARLRQSADSLALWAAEVRKIQGDVAGSLGRHDDAADRYRRALDTLPTDESVRGVADLRRGYLELAEKAKMAAERERERGR